MKTTQYGLCKSHSSPHCQATPVSCSDEGSPLYPVPVLMDAGELETLYYRLMPPAGNC